MGDDDLDIPESNREIALHLRSFRLDFIDIKSRLTALENARTARRSFFDRALFQNLLLPCLSGAFLFLLTKLL